MAKPETGDDQEKRVEYLKHRAEDFSGGQIKVRTMEDLPAKSEESFWNYSELALFMTQGFHGVRV